MKVKLKNGKTFLIDDADATLIEPYSWWALKTGYIVGDRNHLGKRERKYLHRLILNAPEGCEVDHLNKDKSDNRRSNLRLCSRSSNGIGNTHRGASSHLIGVSRTGGGGVTLWRARLTILRGKNIHLGTFKTDIEAAIAYDVAAIRHHGVFAKTNFLPPMPEDTKIEIKYKV